MSILMNKRTSLLLSTVSYRWKMDRFIFTTKWLRSPVDLPLYLSLSLLKWSWSVYSHSFAAEYCEYKKHFISADGFCVVVGGLWLKKELSQPWAHYSLLNGNHSLRDVAVISALDVAEMTQWRVSQYDHCVTDSTVNTAILCIVYWNINRPFNILILSVLCIYFDIIHKNKWNHK